MYVCLLSRYRLSNCILKITHAGVHAVRFSQLLGASFLVALETQNFVNNLWNWWSMDPPGSREISLGSEVCLPDYSDSTVLTFSSVCALHLPLPRRLWTILNFTSSLLMLFFVQPLFINSVINCRALYPLHSCRLLIKICLLYWAASKLPRLLDTVSKFALFSVSDLKDEKLIKE